MRYQTLGDKREFQARHVRNDEASTTISAGMPVVLSMDGTEDGLAVELPRNSTALAIGAFQYGIATQDIAPGKIGEVLVNGIHEDAIICLASRAASTDSFASYASIPLGAILTINTVANALSLSAASSAGAILGYFLAESVASGASSASATSNTSTTVTTARKVFVRLM
jgi:hypothetical protein